MNRFATIFTFLFLGLSLGILISYWYFWVPSDNEGFDHDSDGVFDEEYIRSKAGRLISLEIDRNLDGKKDFLMDFHPNGLIKLSNSDEDFDGTFETIINYVNNQASAVRMDTNADGEFDLYQILKHGVVVESYIINPSTELIQNKYIFNLSKLVKSYKDLDSDGVFEIVCDYDFFESEECRVVE